MKIKFSTNTVVVSLVIVGLLVGLLFTNVMAQDGSIDEWVKIIADSWAYGDASDQQFIAAMEFLIEAGVIRISDSGSFSDSAGNIPIGTIIDWYRPTPSTPTPFGFEIADGRMITDRDSLLRDTKLPDLRDKFIMGAKDETWVGRTGGGDSSVHSVAPPGAPTSNDGDHNHKWAWFEENGKEWWGGMGHLEKNWGNGVDKVGGGIYPIEADRDLVLFTDFVDSHFHTVDIAEKTFPDEDYQGPPYVGLLKIMRTK